MKESFVASSLDETRAIARGLAGRLKHGAVVFLRGDLGAGKTTFATALSAALGADEHEVASPTFALVHEYPLPSGETIAHLDGYRLSGTPREWQEIGADEIAREARLTIVEWPRGPLDQLIAPDLQIDIEVGAEGERRFLLGWSA